MIKWNELFRLCRVGAGLTQKEVAERSYCSQSLIVAYEQGKVLPKVDVADRILAVCGWEFGIRPKRDTFTAEEVASMMRGVDNE